VAPSPKPKRELHERGAKAGPLRIWRLPFDERTLVDDVRQAVVAATAGEIVRLLKLGETGDLSVDGRRLDGGDVAVLVRTHAQARLMAQALRDLGVNCVRIAQESVFHTPEAEQLERMLMALVEPRREPLVRAALATDLLGWDGAGIDALNRDDRRQSELLETFHAYHRCWRDEGFIAMFRQLLQEQGVEQRLLAFSDGERRLTNLYQLGELLQRQDRTSGGGLEGLLKWCSRQRQAAAGSAEERLLRLESDSNLVKIVTLHASKGLEYPLVFCPFAWDEKVAVRGESYLFHDPQAGYRAVLELGSPGFERNKPHCLQEELAENLRLLYVALTRARYRVYLPWGKVKGSGGSALAWLLHGQGSAGEMDLQQWATAFKKLGANEIDRALEALVEDSAGAISVEPLPHTPEQAQLALGLEPAPGPARVFKGQPRPGPRVGSFSSLIAGHGADLPDHDAATAAVEETAVAASLTIHGFPRGPKPGTCLHAIFEHLDFTAGARDELERLVEQNLAAYGLERRWTPVVADCVESVLATPLNREGVRLGLIGRQQRINEMEFHYPIGRLEPRRLAELARQHRFAASARIMSQFDLLHFPPLEGFMKGYIDLVFESGGRFYLLDYKSNWLGGDNSVYTRENLELAMLSHHYPLQYLFYTLALHRYLRQRLAGYDYEQHFGGVFYLFLRGMDAETREGTGVFQERPPKAFIEALDLLLGEA
jgi:exodeoxyribonuclease V beta subunit